MKQVVRILAIDGGGIRGVLPAMVLADLERRAGRPVAEMFDVIAGTSTGGLLALGLAAPGPDGRPAYSAEQMAALYEREGPRIFSRSTWHRIRSLGSIGDQKYPSHGIDAVLREAFGEARLSEAVAKVVVPSYEIERRIPFFFKSETARQRATHDFPMWQVARATTAAPTYFEPACIPNGSGGDYWALIDGGVYANNPAACALVEARTLYPEARRFQVLSLGTGVLTRPIPYADARRWGLAQWAKPVLDVVLTGVADTVHYQLGQLLPEGDYVRIQATLPEGAEKMDETGPDHLRALRLIGEKLVRENAAALERLSAELPEAAGVSYG